MRVVLSIIAMTVFGVAAQATPFVPSSSIPDATKMIPIKMSNMTCKEMMRMHQKMMAGKTMTCKDDADASKDDGRKRKAPRLQSLICDPQAIRPHRACRRGSR